MNTKIITLGVALSTALIAGSAKASCSANFEADGQCAVEIFLNDSATGQTNASTRTTLGRDCEAKSPSNVLDAEDDDLRHGNLTLTMADAHIHALPSAEAVVGIDTHCTWFPLSDRAPLALGHKRRIGTRSAAQGHLFGQYLSLDYRGAW